MIVMLDFKHRMYCILPLSFPLINKIYISGQEDITIIKRYISNPKVDINEN